MACVISVHEYVLRPSADEGAFECAIQEAERRGLLELPGLVEHRFLKGIRGARRGCYAAVWIYESKEAWEALWGPVDGPRSKDEYPENWLIWEDGVLAPFLDRDPDKIRYTSYECL